MDWIFEHLKVVLFIGIIVFSLAKRFLEAKRQAAEENTESPIEDWTPPPSHPPQRRVSLPPPLAKSVFSPPPLTDPPARHHSAPQPQQSPLSAAMTEAASAMQRQHDMMERLQHANEAKALRAKNAGSSHRSPMKIEKLAEVPAGGALSTLLGNRSDIRRAIVLREVLGPPLGMR